MFHRELKCPYLFSLKTCSITGQQCRIKDRCRTMLLRWAIFLKANSSSSYQPIGGIKHRFILQQFVNAGGIRAWTLSEWQQTRLQLSSKCQKI